MSSRAYLRLWLTSGLLGLSHDFSDGTHSGRTTSPRCTYLDGDMAIEVDARLTGQYRVNGGDWQDTATTTDLQDEPLDTLEVVGQSPPIHRRRLRRPRPPASQPDEGESMPSTRAAAACAAIALTTSGLAACSVDEPTTTASPTSVDTGSSTSSASGASSSSQSSIRSDSKSRSNLPGDIPNEAREETKAGAAAFGKYYYKAMGDASHSGKTDELVKLSLEACPPCEQVVEDIEADAKINRTRGKDPYRFTNVRATKSPDEGYKVSINVQVRAHKVYENGEAIGSVDPRKYTLTEHVVWSDGRWQVQDWIIT